MLIMKFAYLAKKLAELEKVSSRNTMTVMLSELINEIDINSADKVMYLVLGRLRPLYDNLEFSLAEKQIQKAIARAVKVDEKEINRKYKDVGDLGEVVTQVVGGGKNDFGVVEVYEKLEAIAMDEGVGSQDRKIDDLATLLNGLDPISGKYVVRIIMGKLRLGFSDKTILDALSWAMSGDKSSKKMLESAYQVRPDIGWLVKSVKDKGVKQTVDSADLVLGVPISPMLCQRLKGSEEMIKKMGRVAVEPKFDGTRVQIHFQRNSKSWMVKTYTRNLDETTNMFPELLGMADHVNANELVLDSEAIGYDPKTGKMLPFQMTITRKRKHGVDDQASKVPLKFYVFDVMYVDGKSLVNEAYEKRREILQSVIKDKDLLVVDKYWETDDPDVIRAKHEELLKEGLEGVIVKKLGSKYIPGRTGWNWVKMKEVEESHAKLSDTVDCVVMGYYRGKGKRTEFGVGAFLAGIKVGEKIMTVTKVGTGLSDDQFRELKKRMDVLVSREKPSMYVVEKNLEPDVWVHPELVVELAADEVTQSPTHSSGVALRFPRLIKFRDDKGTDQTTSLKELSSL